MSITDKRKRRKKEENLKKCKMQNKEASIKWITLTGYSLLPETKKQTNKSRRTFLRGEK